MRPDDRDAGRVWDMIAHGRLIAEFVRGAPYARYVADPLLRFAVERAVEIIGEAASHVSSATRSAHPEIPWQRIANQRHVLAHEYGRVEHERIWRVATELTPALVSALEQFAAPPPPPSDRDLP